MKICVVFLLVLAFITSTFDTSFAESGTSGHIAQVILGEESSSGIFLELVAPDYQLEQVILDGVQYTQVFVPGANPFGDAGAPELPMVSALIVVPPAAELKLHILDRQSKQLEAKYLIAPVATPVAREMLESGTLEYIADPIAYSDNQFTPALPARIGAEAWLRDQRVVRVEFFPFQYLASTEQLVWNSSVRVQISFSTDLQMAAQPLMRFTEKNKLQDSPDSPYKALLHSQLLNYSSAKEWRGIPASQLSSPPGSEQQTLLNGESYKITITKNGIYKVSCAELQQAGIDIDSLDPTYFTMTNQGRQVAIIVNGDWNPVCGDDDYILFFGEEFDGSYLASIYADENANWRDFFYVGSKAVLWEPQFNATMIESYTNKNVYWLSEGSTPGLRMDTKDGSPGSALTPTSYRATVRAEQSKYWMTTHFTSEDIFFWQSIPVTSSVTRTYTTTLTSIAFTGANPATITGEVASIKYSDSISPDHRAKIYLNRNISPIAILDFTWDGISRYHFLTSVPASQLSEGINVFIYSPKSTGILDTHLFDWFAIEYDRLFVAQNNEIDFTNPISGTWKYSISDFLSSDLITLDVTQALSPMSIGNTNQLDGALTFQVKSTIPARYFIGQPKQVDQLTQYLPPDLSTPADYVIISHSSFITTTGTQALADYRAGQGYTPLVVDIEDLYNLFNFGIYHPIAIKNFIASTINIWGLLPDYVVLVGDGHWNLLGNTSFSSPPVFMPPNLSWVDALQGEVDSDNLLATVVGSDPLPDVIIARIPVTSVSQLSEIVDKTIAHEQASVESWQKRIIFVADNVPDPVGEFVKSSESIISDFHMLPMYTIDRQYLDYFTDTNNCGTAIGRNSCPNATQALIGSLNNGALILNYTGHAAMNRWAHEGILINENIPSLANGDRLPILFSMDCLDGYWIWPSLTLDSKNNGPGLAEELLRSSGSGIVAAFSPNGLGVASGHDYLVKGAYERMFNGEEWHLGEAARDAKVFLWTNQPAYVDLINTYTVFGDPALRSPALIRNLVYLPILLN